MSPDDVETAFVAAYVNEVGRPVDRIVTSLATFDRGTAMTRILHEPIPSSCCLELSWPEDLDLANADSFIMQTWSADAAGAINKLLKGIETGSASMIVIICAHDKLAGALTHAIMNASALEDPTLQSASTALRVVESATISGGGPAFILHMESEA